MKKFTGLLVALLLATSNVLATTGTDKQLDSIQNSTGGSALAVPSVGTTFATDTNTLTMSSKTLSAPTLTGTTTAAGITASGVVHLTSAGTALNVDNNVSISGTLLVTGGLTLTTTLTVAQGGTGDATLTAHNVLLGEGTSPVAFAAPVQFQALIGNASGDPSFQALPLNQATAVTSQLGVPNGGTGAASLTAHDVIVGNGTSAVTLISPTSNTGYVLTSNGTGSDPTFQPVTSAAPTVNNSVSSPQSVTAVGGISLSTPTYQNIVFVKGGTPSSNVTVTATPSITACTVAGQVLYIISESSSATFTLQNNSDLAGSQLLLNGPWTSGENSSTPNTLTLMCDGAGTPSWVEVARNN